MKSFWKSSFVFLILGVYMIGASISVHAKSMQGMDMGNKSNIQSSEISSCSCSENDIDTKKNATTNLDCIQMCVGEYDGYFASVILMETKLIYRSFDFDLRNIIYNKNFSVFESLTDPPVRNVGTLPLYDFHKILVKRE